MPAIDVTIEGKNKIFETPDYFPSYPKSDTYCPESSYPSYKRHLKGDEFILSYFINVS